jgi:hypothetical protein
MDNIFHTILFMCKTEPRSFPRGEIEMWHFFAFTAWMLANTFMDSHHFWRGMGLTELSHGFADMIETRVFGATAGLAFLGFGYHVGGCMCPAESWHCFPDN